MAQLSTPYIDIHTHNHWGDSGALNTCRIPGPQPPAGHAYTVGIHPWDAEQIPSTDASYYQDLLIHSLTTSCIAIGEIGLDYTTAKSSEQKQRQLFWLEWQLQVATERSLPVIIHCVKAYNELIKVLKRHPNITSIIHGYIGSPELADRLLQSGCYLSFGPRTWASPKTQQALQHVPLDRLFFETDDSQRSITEIYALAAETTGQSLQTLQKATANNVQHIFGSTSFLISKVFTTNTALQS